MKNLEIKFKLLVENEEIFATKKFLDELNKKDSLIFEYIGELKDKESGISFSSYKYENFVFFVNNSFSILQKFIIMCGAKGVVIKSNQYGFIRIIENILTKTIVNDISFNEYNNSFKHKFEFNVFDYMNSITETSSFIDKIIY